MYVASYSLLNYFYNSTSHTYNIQSQDRSTLFEHIIRHYEPNYEIYPIKNIDIYNTIHSLSHKGIKPIMHI